VLKTCYFDMVFMCVLSGWNSLTHDILGRKNELKVV